MSGRGSSIRWAFNFGAWNPTESQVQWAASCIQDEERARIARFVYKKDAKASLVGRLLMRKFVSECCGHPYAEIRFGRDERGKPHLIGGEGTVSFNVSHQGSYAVLAGECGPGQSVGVDVMKLEYSGGKSVSDFFRIMTRHFSPLEWDVIRGDWLTTDQERVSMFCRHWCLKESYVKGMGTGITVDLQRISFQVKTHELRVGTVVTDTELEVHGRRLADWVFEESLLDQDHCVAVALSPRRDNHASNMFKCLDFTELMNGSQPLLPCDSGFSSSFMQKEERPVK